MLGEAVLGNCPSAEKIDLTRFWNWADSPADSAPAIARRFSSCSTALAVNRRRVYRLFERARTTLPSLINNVVLTPPTPDTSLLQALSKSAASQQDFSPSLTGAQQLAGLLTNAQNTSNSARSDALKASNQLISQAMTTAASMLSSPMSGSASPSTTGQTKAPATGQTTPQAQAQGQTQSAATAAAGGGAAVLGATGLGTASGSGATFRGPTAASAGAGASQPSDQQSQFQFASYQTGGTAGSAGGGRVGTAANVIVGPFPTSPYQAPVNQGNTALNAAVQTVAGDQTLSGLCAGLVGTYPETRRYRHTPDLMTKT